MKVICHVPHSSSKIPNEYKKYFVASDDDIKVNLFEMTDWFTDLLYDGEKIVYPISRLVCDPERFLENEEMEKFGMGAIYTNGLNGKPLKSVPYNVRKEILERFYFPHQKIVEDAIQSKLNDGDNVLIIDTHSFNNTPLWHELDKSIPRPEICIGTTKSNTPDCVRDVVLGFWKKNGFVIKENSPFCGSFVPIKYMGNKLVNTVMIEINKSVYMNEKEMDKKKFLRLKQLFNGMINEIFGIKSL